MKSIKSRLFLNSNFFIFDEFESLTSFYKPNLYDEVYNIGISAVERFGKDPETFNKTIENYKPEAYKELIKERAKYLCASRIRFDSWSINEYINCMIAILQVDLECPGFIKNFPEAIDFLKATNSGNLNRIVYSFEDLYDSAINTFNRYSGQSDFEYVKELFSIPEESKDRRYDEKNIRFDDYISLNFSQFWKTGDEEMKDYLLKYYVHPEILLPDDYRRIIRYLRLFDEEVVDIEKGDMKWIDLYFENLEKILDEVYSEIHSMYPSDMRKINLTLTSKL